MFYGGAHRSRCPAARFRPVSRRSTGFVAVSPWLHCEQAPRRCRSLRIFWAAAAPATSRTSCPCAVRHGTLSLSQLPVLAWFGPCGVLVLISLIVNWRPQCGRNGGRASRSEVLFWHRVCFCSVACPGRVGKRCSRRPVLCFLTQFCVVLCHAELLLAAPAMLRARAAVRQSHQERPGEHSLFARRTSNPDLPRRCALWWQSRHGIVCGADRQGVPGSENGPVSHKPTLNRIVVPWEVIWLPLCCAACRK
jgi:hypothetical protein